MSTPEQPENPQLTRRQLRELRNTASTPIITPEGTPVVSDEPEPAVAAPLAVPLAREAEPVIVAEEPPADEDVDLDAPALTRRSARQQERLRTASVPVISEADAAADAALADAETPEAVGVAADADADADAEAETEAEAPTEADAVDVDDIDDIPQVDLIFTGADAESETADTEASDLEFSAGDREESYESANAEDERPLVAPAFGSGLLAGESVELELPASFDQLLRRGSTATGALSAPNALILSQTPENGSLISPVTATGEVLITGTFSLPDSFGSTGTVPGSSDGTEADAVLVDGELPAASSPTPIAASAAISTIKSAEDIIKPPAPEKGSRLMLALVIIAGALALALTGVLIVALVTGAFS